LRIENRTLLSGVSTFFFPDDAKFGEPLHRVMRQGVNTYDRVILICSQASLTRRGVLNEIEETRKRESRDGGESHLIPIRLDDYLFNNFKDENPEVATFLQDRVVADFTGTEPDNEKFDRQFERLVSALKKAEVK
jgi:hypothetical protein